MEKQGVILKIRDKKNVTIQPYLPEKYCPTPGYLVGDNLPKGCAYLIGIEHCERCYIESVKPSPTGEPYYTTY